MVSMADEEIVQLPHDITSTHIVCGLESITRLQLQVENCWKINVTCAQRKKGLSQHQANLCGNVTKLRSIILRYFSPNHQGFQTCHLRNLRNTKIGAYLQSCSF